MDLNELLYAHQLAMMNADTPHASREGREGHLQEAGDYADKIRMMPGSLDISLSANPGNASLRSLNSTETDQWHSARTSCKPAALSAWESEGGAIASPYASALRC